MSSPEARRWLQEAESDRDTAQYLADGRRFHTACFMAQQAAEKAVTAFLYACGVEDPWGHSVDALLADAVTFDSTLEDVRPLGAVLDKYDSPTRYPNGLPGGLPSRAYVAADAQQAIETATRVLTAMRERIEASR